MKLSLQEIQGIQMECRDLVERFAVYSDSARYEQLAALFIEQGSFARPTEPDRPVVGRTAILDAMNRRPAERVTRHLCSNIIIDVIDTDNAIGKSYVILYTGNTNQPAERFGLQADPVRLVGEFDDEFVRTSAGWRFSKRSGKVVFTG